MMDKNQQINLTIDALSSEGAGIGRCEGMAVFVPGTAPGDQIRAKILKVRQNCAFGKLERILLPSPDRIEPDCPVFGQCGGCVYRHMAYPAELDAKARRVEDAMRRIGKTDLSPAPILGAEQTHAYRNKAQYPLSDAGGALSIGFYAPRSHRVVDCRNCRLQPPEFTAALTVMDAYIRTYQIPCYQEKTGRGLLRHLYLRKAEATGEILVCIVINGRSLPHQEALVQLLRQAVPGLTCVCLNCNRRRTNVILGEECIPLYGHGYITDVLCGNRIRISPLSFYQVNRAQAERLYAQALEYLAPTGTEILLDLYCGAGTIGLSMAGRVRQVIGVEVVEQAVRDARENARINGIRNARFLCADAGQAAEQLRSEGVRPNAVLVDPPRKGCSVELLRTITAMSPEKLIYVSCDPATLARDCARLSADGWAVQKYIPVDLFPRTSHVETVAVLSRKSASKSFIPVSISPKDIGLSEEKDQPTYANIRDYVQKTHGMKVSTLYVAQMKAECGLETQADRSGDKKQPKCPPEKREAILDAFRHFGMID